MLVPKLDLLSLEFDSQSIYEIKKEDLPENWTDYPAPSILAEIAEQWIQKNEFYALRVPSCIIHSAFNFILNCRHPIHKELKLINKSDFHFDSRLTVK